MTHLKTRAIRSRFTDPIALQALEQRVLLSAAAPAYHLALLPNESTASAASFSDQWYLHNTGQTLSSNPSGPASGTPGADISASAAWNLTTGSKNVVVAVFDTGIDLTHPDLVNNIYHNPGEIAGNGKDDDHDGFVDDVNGWNFVDNNNNVQDTSFTDHGTLVSGVIGAEGNNGLGISGVDWHVSILPIKVATDTGVSSPALQAGIAYVEMLKARGVNIVAINASYVSFGIPSGSDLTAIEGTANYGILYVAAAGNNSFNFDSIVPAGFFPQQLMLVAATDNQDQLASFSDYGANSVAIGAPGVDILSTMRGGGYGIFSGTSFAAPMVSGAAALLKAYDPAATEDQIRNALFAGSTVDPSLVGKTITGRRLNVYGALQVLVGNRQPIAHADAVTKAGGASGWAFDYNAGAAPVAVGLFIDHKLVAAKYANGPRADLTAGLGSPNHAFSFGSSVFGNLTPGNHLVQLYAFDIPGAGPTLAPFIFSSTIIAGPQPPLGRLEGASATTVTGWAIDLDTPATAVMMAVYVDGEQVGTPSASVQRSDLQKAFGSGNHGFSFTLPTPLSLGLHRVDLYARDTTSGAYTYLGTKEVNTNFTPAGSFDLFNGAAIKGWAFDANSGADPIQIRYQVDANAPVLATAGDVRAGLQNVLGSDDHAFNITLPQLMPGVHSVSVWAVDPGTHALTLLGKKSARVVSPAGNALAFGAVVAANTAGVTGYAYDPSTPFASIQVRVDVDGVTGTPFTANARNDALTPIFHGPFFGFSKALALSAGPHRLDIYAIDATSGTPVLIASRLVGDPTPSGSITTTTPATLTGDAILTATPTTPAPILLTVNGVPVLLSTADSSNHYAITLPHLLPGSYTLSTYALDPLTLSPTLLGTTNINVTFTNQ